MLYFLGVQPNFKICIHCGKSHDLVGLSLERGGMECKECETINIGFSATEIIKHFYIDKNFSIRLEDLEVLDYLSGLIDKYYEIHFPEMIKSIKVLKELKIY